MKIAISHWQGRISPVFDVAGEILLAEVVNEQIAARQMIHLGSATMFARVREMVALGIDLLICGAISLGLERSLRDAGIEVIGFSCGAVEEVLHAVLIGRFKTGRFRMPGARWGKEKTDGRARHSPKSRQRMRRSRCRAGQEVSLKD